MIQRLNSVNIPTGLDPETLTLQEAPAAVKQLVNETLPQASSGYYVERMQAIGELLWPHMMES